MFNWCYGQYAYLFDKNNSAIELLQDNARPGQIELNGKWYHADLARWLIARRTKYVALILLQLVLIIMQCVEVSKIKAAFKNSTSAGAADKLIIVQVFMIVADAIQMSLYTAALYYWNDLQKTLYLGNVNLIFVLFAKMTFLLVPYLYVFGISIGVQIYIYLFPYFFANITIFRILKNSFLSYTKSRLVDNTLMKKLYYVSLLIYVPILLAIVGLAYGLYPINGWIYALVFEVIYVVSSTITSGYYGDSRIKRVVEIASEVLCYAAFIFIFEYIGVLNFVIMRVIISLTRIVHVRVLLGDFIMKHFGDAHDAKQEANYDANRDENRDRQMTVLPETN